MTFPTLPNAITRLLVCSVDASMTVLNSVCIEVFSSKAFLDMITFSANLPNDSAVVNAAFDPLSPNSSVASLVLSAADSILNNPF